MNRPRLPRVACLSALVAAWLLLLVPVSSSSAATLDGVCARVQEMANASEYVITGVVLIDLATGDRCELDGQREFRMASLYKTLVLAELYRQVEAGLVTLDEELTLEPRHSVDDPPEYQLTAPLRSSVGEAAQRMIHFSDNASALALRERLGLDLVAETPEWLGMPDTEINLRFVSTPADQAELYRRIYSGEVVSPEASRAMYLTLADQEITDLIPSALPGGIPVAHKTGTLDFWLHDAGIVRAPGGDFVLVVMTENQDYLSAVSVIRDVTWAAFQPYAVGDRPLLTPELGALGGRPVDLPASELAALQPRPEPPVRPERDGGFFDLDLAAPALTWSTWALIVMLVTVAAVAVALPAWVMRRRRPFAGTVRYGADASQGAAGADAWFAVDVPGADARARSDQPERGVIMRFGTRREDDDRPAPVLPASRSVAQVRAQPVLPSRRLQRLAEHFQAQTELLETMRTQFEDEMEPLQDLLQKQAQAMHRLLANLEERLRPLNEYADGEETNLGALERRIQDGGSDHVARNFTPYVEEQRRRIAQTREQIDQQRVPFLRYGEQQRETVETALTRFDGDIEALEQNLAEQRRVMMRMLDAMRSETFAAVKEYLASRQGVLAQVAESGSTDPAEIGRTVQQLRRVLEQVAAKSDYARAVLEQADQADRALIDVAPRPRALRDRDGASPAEEADAESTEASA